MMQFTEINRYKTLLMLVTGIKYRPFLVNYAKNITAAIKNVQKSKSKEMKNTQQWLTGLLRIV